MQAKTFWTALIFSCLCLGVSMPAIAQKLHVSLKVKEVSFKDVIDNPGNNPDPTWEIKTSLGGLVSETTKHIIKLDAVPGSYSEDIKILEYNDTPTAGSINLCDGPDLSVTLNGWEDDTPPGNTYNTENCHCCLWCDDDFSSGRTTIDLWEKLDLPGDTHEFTIETANKKFTVKFVLTLHALDAISTVRLQNASGQDQTVFCEGDIYRVTAELNSPYIGGEFNWRSGNNGFFRTLSQTTAFVEATTETPFPTYQVRLDSSDKCVAQSTLFQHNTGAINIETIPAAPLLRNVNATGTETCEGESDGVITFFPPVLASPDLELNLTLKKGDVVEANKTLKVKDLPFKFENLGAGTYSLKYTTILDGEDDLPIGNCTREIENIVVKENKKPVFDLGVTEIECAAGTGFINVKNIVSGADRAATIFVHQNGVEFTHFVGGGGLTAVSLLDIPAGTYEVFMINGKGCRSLSKNVTLTEPPPVIVSGVTPIPIGSSGFHIGCKGERSGQVRLNVSGGKPPYFFKESNTLRGITASGSGPGLITLSDLGAGETEILIQDSEGCPVRRIVTLVEPETNLSIAPPTTTEATGCGGQGQITINASGGAGGYHFGLDDPNPTGTSNILMANAGEHTIYVKDAAGCVKSSPVSIGQTADLDLVLADASEVSCKGGSDGNLFVDVSGGTEPYEFSLDGGAFEAGSGAGNAYSNLTAGTHRVQVRDATGCTDNVTVTIEEPGVLTIDHVEATPSLCRDGFGSIELTFGGFKPNFTFGFDDNFDRYNYRFEISLDGGQTYSLIRSTQQSEEPVLFFGVEAGTHDLKIRRLGTDCESLPYFESVEVENPPVLEFELIDFTNESCPGANDGTITLKASGGRPPYILELWQGRLESCEGRDCWFRETVQNTEELFPDEDGTVTYTFSDLAPSVFEEGSFSQGYGIKVTDKPLDPSFPFFSQCNITLPILPSFLIDDSPIDSSNQSSTQQRGTHMLSRNTAISETEMLSILPANPIVVGSIVSSGPNLNCNGNNGEITVSGVSGGLSPYEFALDPSNFQTSPVLTGAESENTVHIRDANGCIITQDISIPDGTPTLAIANVRETKPAADVNCVDKLGDFQVEITGGLPPYEVSVFKGPDVSCSSPTSNDQLIRTLQMTEDIFSIEGMEAGIYSLLVKDGSGCSSCFSEFVIGKSPALNIIVTDETRESCSPGNDGTISLEVSGGTGPFTLQKNFAEPMILDGTTQAIYDQLSVGPFRFSVEDQRGCIAFVDTSIRQVEELKLDFTSTDVVGCPDDPTGSLTVTPTNGVAPYTLTLHPSTPDGVDRVETLTTAESFTLTGIKSGEYEFILSDANGCEALTATFVNGPAPIDTKTAIVEGTTCLGSATGSIAVEMKGGQAPYEFSWQGPNGFIANSKDIDQLFGGDYNLTVTDAGGCSATFDFNVADDVVFDGNFAVADVTCFGETDGIIFPSITGGVAPYEFSIDGVSFGNETEILSNLASGTYDIQVKDANNCVLVAGSGIVVAQPEELIANIGLTFNDGCNEATLEAQPTGGTGPYSFIWDNDLTLSSGQLSNVTEGTHTLVIMDEESCIAENTISVSFPGPISLANTVITEPGCGNNEAMIGLTVQGGTPPYSFDWAHDPDLDSEIATNLAGGIYSVKISDALGCEFTESFQVEDVSVLSLTHSNTDPSCFNSPDGSISVSVSGGTGPGTYTFLWNDPAAQTTAQATGLASGTYEVKVIDGNGCELTRIIELTTEALPIFLDVSSTSPSCADFSDGSIQLNASGGSGTLNFQWDNGATTPNLVDIPAGTYALTVTDENNCVEETTVELVEGPTLEINLGQRDSSLCTGEALFYDFSDRDWDFSWEGPNGFSSSGKTVLFETSGEYRVQAIDDRGCIGRDTVNLNIAGEPLQALFIVATDVVVGDEVGVVEVSWPAPQKVEWLFNPDSASFLRQELDQYYFTFNKVGKVKLTMKAEGNGCVDWITKVITVHADTTTIPSPDPLMPELIDFQLFPNPNNGIFKVKVDLSVEKDVLLMIYDVNGISHERRLLQGRESYLEGFNLKLPEGHYFLILQTPTQRKSIAFLLLGS